MTKIFCFLSAFACGVSALCAYDAKELFSHLETVSFTKNPSVFYYFETDFDNDKTPEVWVAHDKSHGGGNGLYFHVYQKRGERYEMLDENPVIDTRLLAFKGKDLSDANKRVITYFRHSAESGMLVSYKIENGHIVEHEYQEISPRGKDEALFQKMFDENEHVAQEIPAKNFKQFLKDRGIPCPTTDKVELIGIDLNGTTGETLFMSNPSTGFSAADWLAFHRTSEGKWTQLPIFPEGKKLVFFKSFSFLRKIDGKKFLVCLTQDAPRKAILSFYHIANDRVCGFDIRYICVDDSDVVIDSEEAPDDYAFLEALDFDADKDIEYFHYQVYPAKNLTREDGKITIPGDVQIRDLGQVREIKLPENNRRTRQFHERWKASEAEAK